MNARDATPVCLTDYEPLAQHLMSDVAWAYISGGAADELTLRANRDAFDEIKLKQRVLVDVSGVTTTTTLLDRQLDAPILLAPTATHGMTHPDGEVATAHGASTANAPLVVSTFSNTPIERIAESATVPLWFQLYVQRDRGFTRDLIQRAIAAGCEAICLTVDTPVLGTRNREDRIGFSLAEGLSFPHLDGLAGVDHGDTHHGSADGSIYVPILDESLTWDGIEWIRSVSSVPVILKGLTAPEDAAIAAREEVDGVIVSNHGARNLDTTPATIEALPRLVDVIGGRLPVLMDGGVRRGTDVLKALALGADAVLIGRPYLYGLAVDGASGVTRVVEILRRELAMAMALTGCTTIAAVTESVLWED